MQYRADIDGLRAFAVLSVLIYHANPAWLPGGFIGVDIFFVISGFLITSIIYNECAAGKFSILGFYERRIRRIVPALFVVCIACIPFAHWLMLPDEWRKFSLSLAGVGSFTSNIVFWRESGYFETEANLKPLLHTWSLAVEEQFYIIIPVLMMVLWKLRQSTILPALILLSILSLGLSEWASRTYPDLNFYMLPTRMWELLAGSIIGIMMIKHGEIIKDTILRNVIAALCMVVIIISFFFYSHDIRFPSLWATIPIYATALLILTASGTVTDRFLSWKPFLWIGLASYSIYLWHQPVIAFTKLYIDAPLSLSIIIICIAASITLGFLSWQFIEKPFRDKNSWG